MLKKELVICLHHRNSLSVSSVLIFSFISVLIHWRIMYYMCQYVLYRVAQITVLSFYLQMSKTKQKGKEDRVTMSSILSALNTIIGVIVVVYIGHKWSNYLQLLHENQMFFSNIKVCIISKSSMYKLLKYIAVL